MIKHTVRKRHNKTPGDNQNANTYIVRIFVLQRSLNFFTLSAALLHPRLGMDYNQSFSNKFQMMPRPSLFIFDDCLTHENHFVLFIQTLNVHSFIYLFA